MSFSSDIKDEILHNISIEERKAEKFGELLTEVKTKASLADEFKEYMDLSTIDEHTIKAILKGAFLSAGCIVDPQNDYHFEIVIKNKACADYIYNLLSLLEFTPKLLRRNKASAYVIYFKESEQISIFLSLIGASKAMLKFEQIRVEKDVKNTINRSVNCETANLSKTIKTSVKQIEAINKIRKKGKFDTLNEKLKYTAKLREKYPNESLEFISSKTTGEHKVTKSGLKHRLDKLIQIAQKIT